ncbi:MAG: dipeptidase [Pseudomonadota bacterium]
MKQTLIAIAAMAASGAAVAQDADADWRAEAEIDARARSIHERVLALDTHVDVPLTFATHEVDPARFTSAQVDLPKMRAGGLDAAFFIVYTPQGALDNQGFAKAQRIARIRIDGITRMTSAYEEEIGLALTAKDVERIAKSGRRVALIGMENAYPLGPTANQAEWWRDRGVRYVGITHFGHNQFGDSSNPNIAGGDPEELHGGLSDLGRSLVGELNRLGVMVDVSHAGKKTMLQAAALSSAPIIASHSGVKALADSPRNLDDEQLRALADNGGVVQIVALDVYIKPLNEEQLAFIEALQKEMTLETPEARAKALPSVLKLYQSRLEERWDIEPRASVSDFVDHIDHAVKVAGIDHVGIASDFDGGGGIVGWNDATETLNVTRELVKRGYTEEEIAKIWGGNLLRVLRAVEKEAARLSKG